jgi:hypothetical protein
MPVIDRFTAISNYREQTNLLRSEIHGTAIVEYVNSLALTRKPLVFCKWHNECIVATNGTAKPYVITGRYNGSKYNLISLLRSKKKYTEMVWLTNGQASKNCEEIHFFVDTYGDSNTSVVFPNLESAIRDFIDTIR